MRKEIKNTNGITINLVSNGLLETQVEFAKDGKTIATSNLQKANEAFKKSQNWTNDFYLSGKGFYIPVSNQTAEFIKGKMISFQTEFESSEEFQADQTEVNELVEASNEELRFEANMRNAGFSAGSGFGKVDRLNKFDGNKF